MKQPIKVEYAYDILQELQRLNRILDNMTWFVFGLFGLHGIALALYILQIGG